MARLERKRRQAKCRSLPATSRRSPATSRRLLAIFEPHRCTERKG